VRRQRICGGISVAVCGILLATEPVTSRLSFGKRKGNILNLSLTFRFSPIAKSDG
jgi:hypothetical protein